MSVTVRGADLTADRGEIIRFLYENLTKRSDGLRFNWLYLQNPFGRARAWLAVDEVTQRTLGVAAAFPRMMWAGGTKRPAWILGDFCVAPDSRTLGPALQLQRACLTSLISEEKAICYDLPSRTMMAVYKRLGIPTIGSQVRYVKLNKVDTKVREYVAQETVAKGLAVIGNLVLRLQPCSSLAGSKVTVSVHEGAFGPDFTTLDSSTAVLYRFRGSRTAEYLNWRYRQNPLSNYSVVVARSGSALLGYAVLEMSGTDWFLTDLQAVDHESVIPAVLAHIHRFVRASNAEKLHAPVMEESPLVPYLRRAGFHGRENLPVVACTHPDETTIVEVFRDNWCVMHGDRES